MLIHLSIRNYVLIDVLEIDFISGLTVITGETGAGKSILLGAMGLILGNRSDTNVLLNTSKKCVVEGTFNISSYNLHDFFSENELDYEDQLFIRREISQNGKSRAFINDTPVNLLQLKELTSCLVNIHSQQTTIALNSSNFQLAVLDSFCGTSEVLANYRLLFRQYKKILLQFDQLKAENEKSQKDLDYFQFLFNELDAINIVSDEEGELENELKLINNAEDIKGRLNYVIAILSESEFNIINSLIDVENRLQPIKQFHPEFSDIINRISHNLIDFKDISTDLNRIEQTISFDPERFDSISSRLNLINTLFHKHRVNSSRELIEIKNNLDEKLSHILLIDDKISKLELEILQKKNELKEIGEYLSSLRKKEFSSFSDALLQIIRLLGMPDARFEIQHLLFDDFLPEGLDKINFLFNANLGSDLNEISKIASGGELSRLMLAIKSMISERNLLPTIIFDEIDSGVSGETAQKVGAILKEMSKNIQVITITHLPQIAAKGDDHFFVYKENINQKTLTVIRNLNHDERVAEVAKMLSGENISVAAAQTARELISGNGT